MGEVVSNPRRRDRSADLGFAARRLAVADDRRDDRCFDCAVRPDEGDEIVSSQHGREILDEDAARHFHGEVLDREHLIAAAFGHVKLETHRRRLARWRRETRQALESLALTLRLKRVDARDVPPNVLLFLLHVRALLLELTLA